MAAMVQTFPQQTGTTTMLQTRPSSATGMMPGHSQTPSQSGQQYSQSNRNSFHGLPGSAGGQPGYRGIASGPVQPYAFTSTPTLSNSGQWQSYGALRTGSAPSLPTVGSARPQYHSSASMTNLHQGAPKLSSTMAHGMSRDDSTLYSTSRQSSSQQMGAQGQPTFAQVVSGRPAPDRYRRQPSREQASFQSQNPGSAVPSGSGMNSVLHLYSARGPGQPPIPRNSATLAARPHSLYGYIPGMAADDILVQRQPTEAELKRFRRRSMHSFDSSDYPNPLTPQELKKQSEEALRSRKLSVSDKAPKPSPRIVPVPAPAVDKSNASSNNNIRPSAAHTRNGSSESLVSSRSSNSRPSSSANRSVPTASPASTVTTTDDKSSNPDSPKQVNIPPRSSSTDARRVINPSPLSKPATMASDEAAESSASAAPAASATRPPGSSGADSPAAKQLAAINEKGKKAKGKTSRLRRAFSFGSAAELKKAVGPTDSADDDKTTHDETGKLRKEPDASDLYEQEQARIAQKQEAAGLGNSIYSGTKIFAGSTDNLSISSTASSASIMLRKMGKGMKKGGRSLVGLFRPKSFIGTPVREAAIPEGSQAAVSMITVEAERERVNVNSNGDLGSKPATGFPHLERNSMDASDAVHGDADRLDSSGTDSNARKSIVGGERERAEVLGAIRKGILKTRSNSPSPSPQSGKGPAFELPMIPHISDSPSSSAPSTPNEDTQKRNGSQVNIGSEDYFMSALKLRSDTKSAPGTPQGSVSKRNATFSPRIIFYDTWPSQEYDRRGEIATCNRLTPMLAQQIKEELNSFKMEMEVHETSKIYTHFF